VAITACLMHHWDRKSAESFEHELGVIGTACIALAPMLRKGKNRRKTHHRPSEAKREQNNCEEVLTMS